MNADKLGIFNPKRYNLYVRIQGALFVGSVVGYIIWYAIHPKQPFVHPHIKAPPYVWPAGCPVTNFPSGWPREPIEISPECAKKEYIFPDEMAYSYGLYFSNKDQHYYRVNNDLLRLECYYNIFEKKNVCSFEQNISKSFYQ